MKQIFIIFLALFIISCNKQESSKKTENNNYLLMATVYQQQSPEYKAIALQTYKLAKYKLQGLTLFNDSIYGKAVVLDLDETVLDNSPYQAKCIIENVSYPEYWEEWINEENAALIPGVAGFLNYADSLGFKIFYVSNRRKKYLQQTINNMNKFNLPAVDSTHIILREDESSKIKRRKDILENYEITLLIGDNLNDFSGDFELEDNNSRIEKVFDLEEKFVDKFIILPNPMYGEWEKALLNGTYKHSKSERDSILISKLQSF